jgi:hypothetical protein
MGNLILQEALQSLSIKSEIEKTDKEIDRMVGFKEEEIGIVERSCKFKVYLPLAGSKPKV